MAGGSVINMVMSAPGPGEGPVPVIGMGATILSYSDRAAATVTAWDPKAKVVSVQTDRSVRVDKNGMSESQDYEYSRDPAGRVHHFRPDKAGRWVEVGINPDTGRWCRLGSHGLALGFRSTYHDFSF